MEIRQMKMSDAMRMLEWKNYPETRKFTIVSNKVIKEKDHLEWLKKNIQFFWIIINGNQEICGAVRIQDREMSIWIDRKFWKKGIATLVIRSLSFKGYTAKIVEGHVASMRAFIKAGFEPIEYKKGYYIFQKQ